MVAISFAKFFVMALFPVPVVMLVMLLAPLPKFVLRHSVNFTDHVLMIVPHPYIPVSLYTIMVFMAMANFGNNYLVMNKAAELYYEVKHTGGITSAPLVSMMAAERNLWMSGCAMMMWIVLGRVAVLVRHANPELFSDDDGAPEKSSSDGPKFRAVKNEDIGKEDEEPSTIRNRGNKKSK